MITVFFIDNIPQHLFKQSDMTIRQEITSLVLSTLKQVIKTKQLVIIPITMYMGLQSTFYVLEYNRVRLMRAMCIPYELLMIMTTPVLCWKHSVPEDKCGYNNHSKRKMSPKKVACNHVRGHCSFGMVTVTVSVPGYRVFRIGLLIK